jgi:predicted PurR-regulated permease PerM
MNDITWSSIVRWIPLFSLVSFGIFFFWSLGDTASLLFLAFVLAYLIQPLVHWFERKNFSRRGSQAITLGCLILLIAMVLAVLGPFLIREASQFVKEIPQSIPGLLSKIREALPPFLRVKLSSHLSWENEAISEWVATLQGVFPEILTRSRQFLGDILLFVLVPIFFIYLFLSFDALRHEFLKFVPPDYHQTFRSYAKELDARFSGYIRGMIFVSIALAIMYAIGLWIAGVPYGILIGIVGGLLSIIPYLGSGIGLAAAIIVTTVDDPTLFRFAGIALTWAIAQSIESYYLTPKLVGRETGINPLFVLLLVIAGARLGGLLGMFVAIPAGSFVWFLLQEVRQQQLPRRVPKPKE